MEGCVHASSNRIFVLLFIAAIQQNPKGYLCLHTDKFIAELQERHWHFSQADANSWIERYQPDFADKRQTEVRTDTGSLRNMGRVF
ncbi:Uncharacterised protein [Enterobacter asburiae]|uniref:Uncharacterized protein n=1 Tax=Enterobacter asburiae TaxID=61645 RepID=A0A376FP48_ENTAS|nr:Uncharacterised protein [Enterobacter asburiae]